MHPLILILLLAAGVCEAVYWQKLACPYEEHDERLLSVWCRQSSADCCSGFTFSRTEHSVDGGRLRVSHDSHSFTVLVTHLHQGEGVYWCGLLSNNDTIIKLAEAYFHSSPAVYIWSLTRWILLPLLPLVTIFTSIYARTITKRMSKKAEGPDDGYETLSRARAEPQYENAASFCELE
ncbi:uncharacterized protein ABDE67_001739 [Symphorus nematophorus]